MSPTLTVALIAAGLTAIFFGYRLFCGLPLIRRGASRTRLFWANALPGALLALLGAGLVTAQTKTLLSHRNLTRPHSPATEDSAFPRIAPHNSRSSAV